MFVFCFVFFWQAEPSGVWRRYQQKEWRMTIQWNYEEKRKKNRCVLNLMWFREFHKYFQGLYMIVFKEQPRDYQIAVICHYYIH